MKLTEYLKKNKNTHISYEILPPLKGDNMQTLFDNLQPLIDFQPACIDVTYHREDVIYLPQENGFLKKQIVRKRPGTVGVCAVIQNRYNIDAIPHILCGGFNKEDTENLLIELDYIGIDNVMALRGDPAKFEDSFKPVDNGHKYANELVSQIADLNNGKYVDNIDQQQATDFCIGVGAYPEKHAEAPNLDSDIKTLKLKVDAGAEYIVTQMFFDNKVYFDFVKKCREVGITIPIIPGLKPITARSQLQKLPLNFALEIPSDLSKAIDKCKNIDAVKKVGVEWCIAQSKELKKHNVPLIHYYTMSRSVSVLDIVKATF